jgi:hypothetical protein
MSGTKSMSLSVVDTPRKESVTTDTVCKKRKTGDTTIMITKTKTAIEETPNTHAKKQKEARLELWTWLAEFGPRFGLDKAREMDLSNDEHDKLEATFLEGRAIALRAGCPMPLLDEDGDDEEDEEDEDEE